MVTHDDRPEWRRGRRLTISAQSLAPSAGPDGDRVRRLNQSGKSLEEAIAAKPFTDLDADWGSGRFKGDDFVRIVYLTL